MTNTEIKEKYAPLDLLFIQERIAQLHLQKPNYLSEAFAQIVLNVANDLLEAMHKCSRSVKVVNNPPEKVSISMIDCCLSCMEEILQELITMQHHQEKIEIVNKFEGIAQSLYDLAACVRHRINAINKQI